MYKEMSMKLILLFVITLFTASNAWGQVQNGKASYYADKFEDHPTASGEKYKHNKLTAAHKTLPFGTVVKITNLANQKSVTVKINDRGPYVEGRVIDLSRKAAEELDFVLQGITDVTIEVIDAGDGKSSGYPKNTEPLEVDEDEYYSIRSERSKPKGFGVQIGAYQEMINLLRLSDNLKASYKKNVTVHVKVINNVKVYSLIIGEFRNRKKAEDFKLEVSKRYPESFIIDYSRL